MHASTTTTALPLSTRNEVESLLKLLRTSHRSLSTLAAAQALERTILDRIFYKGKNQHKSTQIWRKVSETRRIVSRLSEHTPIRAVENIWDLFCPQDNGGQARNWNILSWTEVPEPQAFARSVDQIWSFCLLQVKALEVYEKTWISCSRFIHNTSFLPLTTTIIALISRLRFLLLGQDQICRELWQQCQNLAKLIYPGKLAAKHARLPADLVPNSNLSNVQAETPVELPGASKEDLGAVVSAPSLYSNEMSTKPDSTTAHVQQPDPITATVSPDEDEIMLDVEPPVIRFEDRTSGGGEHNQTQVKDTRKASKVEGIKPKKKKKKTRDEIDDIFG